MLGYRDRRYVWVEDQPHIGDGLDHEPHPQNRKSNNRHEFRWPGRPLSVDRRIADIIGVVEEVQHARPDRRHQHQSKHRGDQLHQPPAPAREKVDRELDADVSRRAPAIGDRQQRIARHRQFDDVELSVEWIVEQLTREDFSNADPHHEEDHEAGDHHGCELNRPQQRGPPPRVLRRPGPESGSCVVIDFSPGKDGRRGRRKHRYPLERSHLVERFLRLLGFG